MAAWPFRSKQRARRIRRRDPAVGKPARIIFPYACHYCERTDGFRSKDHKRPKMYGGGALGLENIVRCCRMCNSIKGARLYEWFVPIFREFLELHGQEYRTANPDDWATIGTMTRKFDAWLHTLQHADDITASS